MSTIMVLDMDFVDRNCVDLDEYIADALTPLNSHLDAFRARTENLIQFVKDKTALKIRRVVKGGSLERGTSLKGRTKSEIVLFLDNFRSVQDMKTKMSDVLAQIQRCLDKYGSGIQQIHLSKLSVQFDVLVGDSWFGVRITPSYDVFANGSKVQDVYHEMSHNFELSEYYSPALTEFRVEAFRNLPVKLHNLIRLLHHWNLHVAERHKSEAFPEYFIESMVLWCWKRAGSSDDIDTSRGMKTVMSKLTEGAHLNIDWKGFELLENIYVDCERRHRHPELPVVLDPVNPTINTCKPLSNRQGTTFWQRISSFATDTSKHTLLRDAEVWCHHSS